MRRYDSLEGGRLFSSGILIVTILVMGILVNNAMGLYGPPPCPPNYYQCEAGQCCSDIRWCCGSTCCNGYAGKGCCVDQCYTVSTEKCCIGDRGSYICDINKNCCYGNCCDWYQCQDCNATTHQCKSRCLPGGQCCGDGRCCPPNTECCAGGQCCDHSQCLQCRNGVCASICKLQEVCCNGQCCDPSNCETCSGDPIISCSISGDPESSPEYPCPECSPDRCGDAGPTSEPLIEVKMPCYQDCKWRFGATGSVGYCYGPCFNYVNIDAGSIPNLPPESCCQIVEGLMDTGCALSYGVKYSNTNCVWIHETFHYEDYCQKLAEGEADLRTKSAFADMSCPGGAASCQEAYDERQADIIQSVREVFDNAATCDEAGAEDAARPCFLEVADAIIEYWFLTCQP